MLLAEVAPWGEDREDLRVEHVRLREMNSRCEHPSNELTHEYPYIIVPPSPEEVRETQKRMESGLEQYVNAKGKIAHRWKPGHGKS